MEATEVKDTKEREIVAHYTSEETHALAQLRLKFPPPSPRSRTPTIEDHVMMRFLRARQLDVNAAFDMLNAALLWRKNNNIDNVLSAPLPTNMNILRSIVPQGWHGFDKFGRPVLYNKIGQMHLDYFVKMDTECIDECHIWEMEMGLRLMAESSAKRGERVSQMVTILDLKGLGLSHRKTIRFMKGTSFLDKFYYPETLGKLYMINAPRVAPVLWAIAKPLLDPRTQEKVTILGTDYQKVLQELIPADQLPTEYGGACKCKGAHTQCLPEVSAAEAKKIFADYKYAVKVTPKLTELQVASRGRQEVSVPIKASKGGEVSYSFHSAKNDIEFSVLFTPAASAPSSSSTVETKKDKQEKLTVLLEPSRQTGSTDEPVSGVVAAPSAGVVRFVFDNSYSRFTAKTIFYHVHAIEDATPPPEPAESKADLAKDFATVKVAEEPAVRGLDATVKVAEEPAVRGLDEGINWVS